MLRYSELGTQSATSVSCNISSLYYSTAFHVRSHNFSIVYKRRGCECILIDLGMIQNRSTLK
jgi:hypothetical protein